MDDSLSIQETSLLLGVTRPAVQRWVDEGLLPSGLDSTGQRRIRRPDAELFLPVPKKKIPIELPRRSDPVPDTRDLEPWVRALLDEEDAYALEGFLLVERGRMGSWAPVCDFLGSVLEEIGNKWVRGEIKVLQEHLASERLVRSLLRAGETLPEPVQAAQTLLVSPEGEAHTLGLSMLEIVLKELGQRTLWVGSRSPLEEVTELIRSGQVQRVASSASIFKGDPKALETWLRPVQSDCWKHKVGLVLGGRGAWPENPRYGDRLHHFTELAAVLP